MGNNVNLEEYAIKFLLYSYFKLTLNSDTESILNSIVERAYQDATMQGAYNTKIKDDQKQDSNIAYQNAVDQVKNDLKKLPTCAKYNDWHEKLCENIIKLYESQWITCFTYGNAQKWVNMTMKYMIIIHGIFKKYADDSDFEEKYGETIDNLISVFHVPIDSYIIDALWIECDKLPFNSKQWEKKENRKKRVDRDCKTPASNNVECWSNWDEGTYKNVQENIKSTAKDEYPIIWEGNAWIEQAMKRNKAPKKSTSIKKPQE